MEGRKRALLFCVFPLSEFNLHAASILQSIVLNRLQCVLLSVPLSLYLTDCGSPVALNQIQVSVHVDACCCGLMPTELNLKETKPHLMSCHITINITK